MASGWRPGTFVLRRGVRSPHGVHADLCGCERRGPFAELDIEYESEDFVPPAPRVELSAPFGASAYRFGLAIRMDDLALAGILLWLFIFTTIGTWVIWHRSTLWKVIGMVCIAVAVVPVAVVLWAMFVSS